MKNKILIVLTVVCLLAFLLGAGMLGYYFWGMSQGRKGVNDLRAQRPGMAVAENAPSEDLPSLEEQLLLANAALHAQNPDFAAWLTVDGTAIDYPVMYTPDNLEYYLRRSFNKEYNTHGTPFLAHGCDPAADPEPDNLTIYGHNIQTGDMFADLLKYSEKDYWEGHRTIQFSTLTEVRTYEIVSCFYTVLDDADPNQFRYDHFVYAQTPQEFDDFMGRVESLQYYDTGIDCEYGDKLLTLSTCASSTNSNGERVVVVARQIA